MRKILLLILLSPIVAMSQPLGNYELSIQNDAGDWLPFRIAFIEKSNQKVLQIINAQETIELTPFSVQSDSAYFHFINYNAEIVFTNLNSDVLNGYWINHESTIARKREFIASKLPASKSSTQNTSQDFAGKWKVTVQLPDRSYNAIFQFEQNNNKLTGTMRTKSGDYRYLEGEVHDNKFYVSTFMGNSIFQISGTLEQGRLIGNMLTTNSSTTKFVAERDAKFELPALDMITKKKNNLPFNLNLKDENGELQNFSNLTKDKVTIVTIFGTWCPNCVDEIDYFQLLQQKFPNLQIIAVAFEYADSEAEQQRRVQGFKNRKQIKTQFLIGGKVSKDNVNSKFPMIDFSGIYPSSFLIDKKGKIKEIHTGFNGPATGILFEKYKEELEAEIGKLMKGK